MALHGKPEALRGAMMMAAIETEGLTKQYGTNRGIRYVDLTV
jgi:hypothetical protein